MTYHACKNPISDCIFAVSVVSKRYVSEMPIGVDDGSHPNYDFLLEQRTSRRLHERTVVLSAHVTSSLQLHVHRSWLSYCPSTLSPSVQVLPRMTMCMTSLCTPCSTTNTRLLKVSGVSTSIRGLNQSTWVPNTAGTPLPPHPNEP